MIRSTRNTALDGALRALRNALVKCDGTAGRRIARNNARAKALGALRRVRDVLDEEYPVITLQTARVRKQMKTGRKRLDHLRKEGWKDVSSVDVGAFAAWAAAIGHQHPTQLRQAKKSVLARRAAIAAEALQ